MESNRPASYRSISKYFFLAAILAIGLWLLYSLREVLLVFLLALIIGIVLNAPVVWLETRKVPRPVAASGVLLALLGVGIGVGYMAVPRLVTQFGSILDNVPTYSKEIGSTLARLLHNPSIADRFNVGPGAASKYLAGLLPHLGRYSLSLIPTLILLIFLLAISVYLVFSPQSVLRSYVEALPSKVRASHMAAFTKGSQLVVGWLYSNLILGVIQAIASGIFLFAIGVPGAIVWGTLALFAELIPVLGAYIMAIPPIIVAAAVRPVLGIWVIVFYVVFNLVKDYVMVPYLRNITMQLSPVYLLFVTFAMTYLFGILGAVVATPLAGFAKSYYDEFYLSRQKEEPNLEEKLDMMVRRETVEAGMPGGPIAEPSKADAEKTRTAMKEEKKPRAPRKK